MTTTHLRSSLKASGEAAEILTHEPFAGMLAEIAAEMSSPHPVQAEKRAAVVASGSGGTAEVALGAFDNSFNTYKPCTLAPK